MHPPLKATIRLYEDCSLCPVNREHAAQYAACMLLAGILGGKNVGTP